MRTFSRRRCCESETRLRSQTFFSHSINMRHNTSKHKRISSFRLCRSRRVRVRSIAFFFTPHVYEHITFSRVLVSDGIFMATNHLLTIFPRSRKMRMNVTAVKPASKTCFPFLVSNAYECAPIRISRSAYRCRVPVTNSQNF